MESAPQPGIPGCGEGYPGVWTHRENSHCRHGGQVGSCWGCPSSVHRATSLREVVFVGDPGVHVNVPAMVLQLAGAESLTWHAFSLEKHREPPKQPTGGTEWNPHCSETMVFINTSLVTSVKLVQGVKYQNCVEFYVITKLVKFWLIPVWGSFILRYCFWKMWSHFWDFQGGRVLSRFHRIQVTSRLPFAWTGTLKMWCNVIAVKGDGPPGATLETDVLLCSLRCPNASVVWARSSVLQHIQEALLCLSLSARPAHTSSGQYTSSRTRDRDSREQGCSCLDLTGVSCFLSQIPSAPDSRVAFIESLKRCARTVCF